MLVLALDSTALTASAACVRFGEDNVLTKYSLYTVKNELTHSENLMPMVDSVLNGMNAAHQVSQQQKGRQPPGPQALDVHMGPEIAP